MDSSCRLHCPERERGKGRRLDLDVSRLERRNLRGTEIERSRQGRTLKGGSRNGSLITSRWISAGPFMKKLSGNVTTFSVSYGCDVLRLESAGET